MSVPTRGFERGEYKSSMASIVLEVEDEILSLLRNKAAREHDILP